MAVRSRPRCNLVTRVEGAARVYHDTSRVAPVRTIGLFEVSLIATRHEGARARSSITGIVPAPSFDNAPLDRD
jgi:hypothetical protein